MSTELTGAGTEQAGGENLPRINADDADQESRVPGRRCPFCLSLTQTGAHSFLRVCVVKIPVQKMRLQRILKPQKKCRTALFSTTTCGFRLTTSACPIPSNWAWVSGQSSRCRKPVLQPARWSSRSSELKRLPLALGLTVLNWRRAALE